MKINDPNKIFKKHQPRTVAESVIKKYGDKISRKIAKQILKISPSNWEDPNGTYQKTIKYEN
jgi:hypothetical protein